MVPPANGGGGGGEPEADRKKMMVSNISIKKSFKTVYYKTYVRIANNIFLFWPREQKLFASMSDAYMGMVL
jgi:hypothetical protein